MVEPLEITKDTLAKDTFLSMLSNVSEVYNNILQRDTITLDENTKILSQIMEAYSFYNQIKQSELDVELSEARIKLNQIETSFQNLEAFRGVQGLKGDKGDIGEQGIQGLKGDKGDNGEQGIQGLKGDTGEQGIQGLKGDTGEQGIQGLKGDIGEQGIQGIQGLKGDKGDTGSAGTTDYNNLTNKPEIVCFSVYRSAPLSLIIDGNFNKITFDTELYDTHSCISSGVFTAPIKGIYNFSSLLHFEPSTDIAIALIKNNSELLFRGGPYVFSTNTYSILLNSDVLLNQGDTVAVYLRKVNGGAALNTGYALSYFVGSLIRGIL